MIEKFEIIAKLCGVGKGSETAYFIGLFENECCCDGGKREPEMGNAHLIADGPVIEMRGLFGFAMPEAREITLDAGAFIVCLFVPCALARYLGAGVVGDIDICGAAETFAGAKPLMIAGALFGKFSLFLA